MTRTTVPAHDDAHDDKRRKLLRAAVALAAPAITLGRKACPRRR